MFIDWLFQKGDKPKGADTRIKRADGRLFG
jgi:hypothetical protein